jgi:hypothetical protein
LKPRTRLGASWSRRLRESLEPARAGAIVPAADESSPGERRWRHFFQARGGFSLRRDK